MKRRKPRNYNGNPLAYYREHFEEFGEYKNRSQLSRGDSGMHRALIRYGQLEEAIPEANQMAVELGRALGKGRLECSSEDKRKIIEAYEPFDGNALKASKHLHYAASTVWTYWKRAGLDARGNKKLSESKNKKLFKAYEKFGGNALKASRNLHHAVATVLRHWRKFGFEIRRRGRRA